MRTLRWDGCHAIHPVEGASQRTNWCHRDLHFFAAVQLTFISPFDLFLPSCSVGVVCPCARQGYIINMSVITYQLAQSFLKKFRHFSKLFFFIVCRWSCINQSVFTCKALNHIYRHFKVLSQEEKPTEPSKASI